MKTISRFNILKANIINSYKVQTAYFFENWASIGSTVFYTFTMVLFIDIIYSNVNLFAGYSENEMFLLLFVGQIGYYMDWLWSNSNINSLIESVRTGFLDTILVKPIPSLFFITFREIDLVSRLKDGVPNILLFSLLVDWSEVIITPINIIFGIIIFLCGQIAWHCFRFLFALPVFFIGQSTQIFKLSDTLSKTNNIPLEGFPTKIRNIFITAIPSLITAQMSVSVMLGKSNRVDMLLVSLIVAFVFLLLKSIGWNIALRNYSSASS